MTKKNISDESIMAIAKKTEPSPYHYRCVIPKKIKKMRERHVRRIKLEQMLASNTVSRPESSMRPRYDINPFCSQISKMM